MQGFIILAIIGTEKLIVIKVDNRRNDGRTLISHPATRAIWKVRSMVVFLSNRLTNPFMSGIILNSYLSSMSGHKYHDNIVMQARNILP